MKMIAKDENQQNNLFTITFRNYMEFRLDKFAKATFKKGKLTKTVKLDLDINTIIKE